MKSEKLVPIDIHYDKLVERLKSKKGVSSASWLGHFITDCLEPMHQIDWKDKNKKTDLKTHFWVEMITDDFEVKKNIKLDNVKDVRKYLQEKSEEIRKIKIIGKPKNKIKKIYNEKVIPQQIKSVASIWYKAVREVNDIY